MPDITGIALVELSVRNLDISSLWYCELLGVREVFREVRGIRLFVLPPRSPKLHGAVERTNRTHTEEFHEVTTAEPELEAFQAELRTWEAVVQHDPAHQALGYLTPAEYLASVGIDV